MFEKSSVRRALAAFVICGTLLAGPALGQEAKRGGSVPITFVPPPMENATYSVGIYDVKTGKLARRLCEAAGQDTFKVGLNGLITSWDGRDDDGKPLPPGKYAARGYAVGPLEVEGVEVRGNDWIADNQSLRLTQVKAIAILPDDGLAVVGEGGGGFETLRYSGADHSLLWHNSAIGNWSGVVKHPPQPLICALKVNGEILETLVGDQLTQQGIADGQTIGIHALTTVVADPKLARSSVGRDNTVWRVEEGGLTQYSAGGEMLRRLESKAGEPVPVAVSASRLTDRLYLLEDGDGWQRVRGLAFVETSEETGKRISNWQTFFERSIRDLDPSLGLEPVKTAKSSSSAVDVELSENLLAPGKHDHLKLIATFDAKGSYLATSEGLRLRLISEQTHLRAVKLTKAKASEALSFFQTDGATWDEFAIKGSNGIIAFDAGEFEIDAAGEKPVTEKAPEPEL